MSAEELPRASIAQRVPRIGRTEIGPAVTFALEAEHRVGPALDSAVDHPGKMHAEKRKARVGNRVDQVSHTMEGACLQLVVIATKSNHAHARIGAASLRHPVALKSRAADDVSALESFARRHDV